MHFEELSDEERERYKGYWHLDWFTIGFMDYGKNAHECHSGGVSGQAYDRGLECAMRRTRNNEKIDHVTIRRYSGGKAHRGLRFADGSWRPVCHCPGAANGSMRNRARIIAEGWDQANCGN
jgi:hypothetical protein